MSWPLLREAQRDGTLGPRQLGAKMVLMFLARRAADDGLVKVGGRVIADETGIDHRHVRRLLDQLAEMGRIDLEAAGANGRGRAHTWRVLSMAEWLVVRTAKEGATPPFRADGKGGVDALGKGATSPPLELPPELPPPPPHGHGRRATAAPAATAAPSLPGLAPGEEGLSALGSGPRAAGRTGRARRRADQERADARRLQAQEAASAARLAELEAYEERAMTPEALAARRELRERFCSPRRAAGGAS